MFFSLASNNIRGCLHSCRTLLGNEKGYDVILDTLPDFETACEIYFLDPDGGVVITNPDDSFRKNKENGTTTVEDGHDDTGIYKITLPTPNFIEIMLAYKVIEKIKHLNKIVYTHNNHFYLEGFSVIQNTLQKPQQYAELLNYKNLGYFVNNYQGTDFRILSAFLELYFKEGFDTYNLISWGENKHDTQERRYMDFYVRKENGAIVIGSDSYAHSKRPEWNSQTWYVILSSAQFKNLIHQWCVLAQQNVPHIILCKHDKEYVFEVPQQPDSIEEFKTYVVPLTSNELTKDFAQFRYFNELNKHTCIKVTSDLCYALVLFFQKMPVENFLQDFLQWLNNGAQERYEIQYFGYITQEKAGLLKVSYYTDIMISAENFITIAQQWHEASTKKIPLLNLEFKDGSFVLSLQLEA